MAALLQDLLRHVWRRVAVAVAVAGTSLCCVYNDNKDLRGKIEHIKVQKKLAVVVKREGDNYWSSRRRRHR